MYMYYVYVRSKLVGIGRHNVARDRECQIVSTEGFT